MSTATVIDMDITYYSAENTSQQHDETPPEPHTENPSHLITKHMFAMQKILTLFDDYKDDSDSIENKLLRLTIKEMKFIDNLNLAKATEEEIQRAYNYFITQFMQVVGKIGNRGERLSRKSRGVCMCFAIDESIKFIDELCRANKMDPKNCCIQWLKRHMLYSILLGGGTDDGMLDTDMAQAIFDELMDMWDCITVCCEGTTTDEKGNQWSPTMEDQLKNISQFGTLPVGVDPMVVWSALGLVNSAWRVAFYHSKSNGKKTTGPYKILISSTRSRDLMHDNPTGGILSNDYVELTFVCHASSMMHQLPNNVIHTLVKINGYTKNVHRFLVDLDGVEICGITLEIPQEWKDMTYFFKLGKIPGYGCNEAEYAARFEILKDMMEKNMAAFKEQRDLSHLARVFAKRISFDSNDDLSDMQCKADSGDLRFDKKEDEATFNELYEKYGLDLWGMLADKREQQLELYDNNTNFKEQIELSRLAAVFSRIHKGLDDLQSKVDPNDPKLEDEKDLATFNKLYKTYDVKLWDMLADKREQQLELYENNTNFKEAADLSHLAAVFFRIHGDLNDLQSKVDINDPKLEEEKDLTTFKKLYKTYDMKLWDMLADKREQELELYENNINFKDANKLQNDLSHVASQLNKVHGNVYELPADTLAKYLGLLQSLSEGEDEVDLAQKLTAVYDRCVKIGKAAYTKQLEDGTRPCMRPKYWEEYRRKKWKELIYSYVIYASFPGYVPLDQKALEREERRKVLEHRAQQTKALIECQREQPTTITCRYRPELAGDLPPIDMSVYGANIDIDKRNDGEDLTEEQFVAKYIDSNKDKDGKEKEILYDECYQNETPLLHVHKLDRETSSFTYINSAGTVNEVALLCEVPTIKSSKPWKGRQANSQYQMMINDELKKQGLGLYKGRWAARHNPSGVVEWDNDKNGTTWVIAKNKLIKIKAKDRVRYISYGSELNCQAYKP